MPAKAATLDFTVSAKDIARVKARKSKTSLGTLTKALVGPTAPHRSLVIAGHRIVTPGGRDTGRRTRPNPFVEAAASQHMEEAIRLVSDELFGK